MEIKNKLKKLHNKIKLIGDLLIEKAAIHIVFFLGIGLTFILAQILNKQFLDKNPSDSSWRPHISLGDNKKMF